MNRPFEIIKYGQKNLKCSAFGFMDISVFLKPENMAGKSGHFWFLRP
jgi:hypothetical protein